MAMTLYLSLCQLQRLGKSSSVMRRHVLLVVKTPLQLECLVVGKSHLPTFTLVRRTLDEWSPEDWLCAAD